MPIKLPLFALVTIDAPHPLATYFAIGLALIAATCTLALGLLIASRYLTKRTGLPAEAVVVAADMYDSRPRGDRHASGKGSNDAGSEMGAFNESLADPETGLCGRPDYVVREESGPNCGKLVPVEVKPTRKGHRLHESDEMQLTAYMILLNAAYPNEFAGYGRVVYKDASFTVELTERRRARCLGYAEGVRRNRRKSNVHRNHNIRGKCAGCSLRRRCVESLAGDPGRNAQAERGRESGGYREHGGQIGHGRDTREKR